MLGLIFFILFLFIFIRESYPSRIWNRIFSKKNTSTDFRLLRHQNVVDLLNLIDSCDLVLIGNSIIERAPWENILYRGTCNMGIGGDFTSNMLARINVAIDSKPEKIIICGGINDVAANVNIDSTISNLISMIKIAKASNIEVYFHPILPVSIDYKDYDNINSKVSVINRQVSTYCESIECKVIDIKNMITEGQNGIPLLASKYTSDGIHPNSFFYKKWRDNILSQIRRQPVEEKM